MKVLQTKTHKLHTNLVGMPFTFRKTLGEKFLVYLERTFYTEMWPLKMFLPCIMLKNGKKREKKNLKIILL
jgi:hypothetical protein